MRAQKLADGLTNLGIIKGLLDTIVEILAKGHNPSIPGTDRLFRNAQPRELGTLSNQRLPLRFVHGTMRERRRNKRGPTRNPLGVDP